MSINQINAQVNIHVLLPDSVLLSKFPITFIFHSRTEMIKTYKCTALRTFCTNMVTFYLWHANKTITFILKWIYYRPCIIWSFLAGFKRQQKRRHRGQPISWRLELSPMHFRLIYLYTELDTGILTEKGDNELF